MACAPTTGGCCARFLLDLFIATVAPDPDSRKPVLRAAPVVYYGCTRRLCELLPRLGAGHDNHQGRRPAVHPPDIQAHASVP